MGVAPYLYTGTEVAQFACRHFAIELENNKYYHRRNYEVALKDTFLKLDERMTSGNGKK